MSAHHELEDRSTVTCIDCGRDTKTRQLAEYYMVKHEVWAETGLAEGAGCLCIGCLEERLGRILNTGDFLDVPVNYDPDLPRSPRLQDRLGMWFALDPDVRSVLTAYRHGTLNATTS